MSYNITKSFNFFTWESALSGTSYMLEDEYTANNVNVGIMSNIEITTKVVDILGANNKPTSEKTFQIHWNFNLNSPPKNDKLRTKIYIFSKTYKWESRGSNHVFNPFGRFEEGLRFKLNDEIKQYYTSFHDGFPLYRFMWHALLKDGWTLYA
jgi:hypothetical protein